MDLEFTEEQKMIKRTASDFIRREIIPQVDEYEKRGCPLSKEEATGFIKKLIPLGYIVGLVPKEHGGLEMGYLNHGILLEQLAYAWASLSGIVSITSGVPLELISRGTDEQKKEYLLPLLSGDMIGCSAITEPDIGSGGPRGLKIKVVPSNDNYVINGVKTWISNGAIADVANLVFDAGGGDIRSILVEKSVSPFTTRELPKLGFHAFSTAEMSFDDCRVPKRNLLKPSKRGMATMFEYPRATIGIRSCGVAQAAIDAAIDYAKTRTQFGKLIGKMQLIQEKIADMAIETEAGRFLSFHALQLVDKGVPCMKESSMAKAFCCEMAVRVTSQSIQIHGAMGLSAELPVERYFRDARSWTIPDGTTEIQKLIVGREVLGLTAFT